MEITRRVIHIDHITSYIDRLSSIIRTGLSQLPDRLSSRIAQETDEETCYHLIMKEMQDISSQLESAMSEEALHGHLAAQKKAKLTT